MEEVFCEGMCGHSRQLEKGTIYLCGSCTQRRILGLIGEEKLRLSRLDGETFMSYRRKELQLSRPDCARKHGVVVRRLREFETGEGICPSALEPVAKEAEEWALETSTPEKPSTPKSSVAPPVEESQGSEESSFNLSTII